MLVEAWRYTHIERPLIRHLRLNALFLASKQILVDRLVKTSNNVCASLPFI